MLKYPKNAKSAGQPADFTEEERKKVKMKKLNRLILLYPQIMNKKSA
jgi:hypothetical protein